MDTADRDTSFDDVLAEAAKTGTRLRFYSHSMAILAKGLVAFIGKNRNKT
ncbi:MAG: hypothetical protein R6V83_10270 [Candidatus Thorarchaeota archaeon]